MYHLGLAVQRFLSVIRCSLNKFQATRKTKKTHKYQLSEFVKEKSTQTEAKKQNKFKTPGKLLLTSIRALTSGLDCMRVQQAF